MKNIVLVKKSLFLLLVLLTLGAPGCAKIGQVIPADRRIMLVETSTIHGSYTTGDLTLYYRYSLAGREMNLKGQVDYRGGFDSLRVILQFLDSNGKILQQKIVYYSGYRETHAWGASESFQATLTVPSGAAAFSFDYFAEARRGHR